MNEVKKKRKDPRTETISSIWGITAGILGICIPLAAVTESGPVLPIFALLGATVSSCVVWLTRPPQQTADDELEKAVVHLSQRVAQLEMDTRDLELRYSIHSAGSAQPPLQHAQQPVQEYPSQTRQ
jgi:hypothetical protein